MKYIIKIALIYLCVFYSCSLEEEPYSSLFTEDFYKTESDSEAGLTAAYGALQNLYNTAGTGASDFSADQTYARPVVGRDVYALFNYDQNYTTQRSFSREFESAQYIWRSCYLGIEKANWVIKKVPSASMNEVRKTEIIGEAYFLRAFYHWFLTKNFGDVILKLEPSDNQQSAYVEKSKKEIVYKQIFSDLDNAIERLPHYDISVQKGRVSKEVAIGLYSKAALYAEEWTVALEKAKMVISSGAYQLIDDVSKLYKVETEDFARTEIMWAFECETSVPSIGSQIHSLFGPRSSSGPNYLRTSWGSALAYQSFFDSFNPLDDRRKLLDTSYLHKDGHNVAQKDIDPAIKEAVLLKKYQDPNSLGSIGANNIPILRFADVLLIAAEAECRLNGPTNLCYDYINQIRKRARLEVLEMGHTKEELIDAILQERSWEFFGEGDRWYDLTRTNTFLEVIPHAVNSIYPVRQPKPKHRYFPIPLEEINANPKLVQNEDWR
ncbi:RagB/SusD family nutrient uptake outer membrane protein [Membranihabitans marinus]|uniref:RagB/SusD family nutrient uptake outer membrane protein n=1 Tax=Membranihabitans marinus TaxID=1227546 RepID=UPI001F228762|nr:RagB/SusD family nutrient uptake outer membrane protein [Membranihabitans marinus]